MTVDALLREETTDAEAMQVAPHGQVLEVHGQAARKVRCVVSRTRGSEI